MTWLAVVPSTARSSAVNLRSRKVKLRACRSIFERRAAPHVEVDLGINALERHAVVMHALAVRAERERRHAPRSAERAVRVQFAAAFGGQQTHVGRIDARTSGQALHRLCHRAQGWSARGPCAPPRTPRPCRAVRALPPPRAESPRSLPAMPLISTLKSASLAKLWPCRIESEIELTRKVSAQPARIDAAGGACDRPALRRAPTRLLLLLSPGRRRRADVALRTMSRSFASCESIFIGIAAKIAHRRRAALPRRS